MYRKIAFLLVLVLTVFIPGLTPAQSPEEAVDMNRIPQKAVRELVRKEKIKTATDFQHIATACYRVEDSVRYQTNLRTFVVKARIGKVWEKYINMTPKKAWSGSTVNFGFLFSRPKNKFIYAENANDPIREGNIIYVNLRLFKGLKNLGVAFEITRLDEANKIICFCYLKDGVSNGSQEIRFTEMANGDTRISHVTHYRSHSAFRDKELYPLFHDKFVGEFHQNILSQIETGL
ncbi:MAG: hypothetical protein D4R64_10420 [Porphyromonadaceae bacterium]|nr:MAG: hypothetical protein D4R64_10420 [Porphyromonadaceae bacterium]